MAFSNNLRYLRKKYDMSQEDLANKLGYKSFTTIQKWESGVSEPSVSMVKKIAELFGVTMDQITNDDLSDTENHYYLDPEAAEIAQEVHQRPELKVLIEASRKVSAADLELVINMMDRLKMYQTEFEKFRQTNGAEDTAEYGSSYEAETIAAHREGDWAKEGLEEVEESEKYVWESDYADARQIAGEIKKEKECADDISGL